jgi:phosphate transport system permease protein
MTIGNILLVLIALGAVAFVVARARAMSLAQGEARNLHSLPNYYGWHGFVMVTVPSFLLLAVWMVLQPIYAERQLDDYFPVEQMQDETARILVMADVRRVAAGLDVAVTQGALTEDQVENIDAQSTDIRARLAEVGVALGGEVSPDVLNAARDYREIAHWSAVARAIAVIGLGIAGFLYALSVTAPDFRARNRVEAVVYGLLVLASTIAILTTVGIVLSLVSEAGRFFTMYPWQSFFFGLTWNPQFRGGSDFGLIPLLWGTLYITFVSMMVAVPLGIFTAIYLSEYASSRVRSVVKPMIEIIAGIPTVVFGLFALVTVGPFLRDWIAEPMGWGTSGSSVMTAGLVIGILNVPFISSLADDIMNAVPQSLRDGSFGLGATQSETIRQVILPAALPGIVGAVLLAGSRAIGETMIVTMGAGAAAQLSLNPFEAMTTITVKIVGQLTGDTAFDSPETLVAFALGITLFVITLALNVLALVIVRKYREQYE